MKYLPGTIGLPLILSIEKYGHIKWYVDAEFGVHKYMSNHTGGFMTMVSRGAYVESKKLKFNTKSSTEAERVVVDNVMIKGIWNRYFLKEQGYEIHENIINQYNQSAIKLENNGRKSSSMQTLHINIIYYLITDRITKQEAYVFICTNLDMIMDYFTKTLQGSQFRHFRNITLGIHEDYIPSYIVSGIEMPEERKIPPDIDK